MFFLSLNLNLIDDFFKKCTNLVIFLLINEIFEGQMEVMYMRKSIVLT